LPFDWLWNLDTGLKAVTEILKNDFQQIENRNCYLTTDHKWFDEKVVVYRDFTSIVHLHTDPLNVDIEHDKLFRRIVRFRKLMNDKSFKHFVYYRSFDEDFFKDSSYTIKDTLNNTISEGLYFKNLLIENNPNISNKFHLLLIIQTNITLKDEAYFEINKIKNTLPNCIDIGYTITRNDEDKNLYMIWKKQWKKCLFNKTKMPFKTKMNVLFTNRFLKMMKSLFR